MQKLEQKLNFAVIGGGISGLSSVYHLFKEFPKCSVTLYERNKSLGGWLNTSETQISNRKIEMGARLIKNDAAASNFYEICDFCGIMGQIVPS